VVVIPSQYRKYLRNLGPIINGKPFTPQHREVIPIIYPGTGEAVAELTEADSETVDLAAMAAKDSLESGVWRNAAASEKRAVFNRIIELTQQHLDELAVLETINTGQTIQYSKHAQLPRIYGSFRFYADYINQMTEEGSHDQDAALRIVTRQPLGVVGLISSSNAPTALAATKVAAALAFGNSCVLKTSENTPLALYRFVELLHEAGVPPGVVNYVNGRGHITGEAMAANTTIRGISFTGGTATAKHIAASGAKTLKRLDMELGGKSANIIMPSCHLDRALDASLLSIYTNNGQQCFAGSRILVHRDVADEFISKFVERAKRIRIGNPFAEGTENGPLACRGHLERLTRFGEIARQEAELLVGGTPNLQDTGGFFFPATAALASTNSSTLCQQEIFGPFATFLIIDSLDEAISIANDSDYGLVSYIWTDSQTEALKASQDIQAGLTLVNSHLTGLDLRLPFGGFKHSAIGREGARGARAFYTEEKTTLFAMGLPALPKLGATEF
jgi:acyl-CoA reductase-like NAD-dependent aldehyde dehydrogenase